MNAMPDGWNVNVLCNDGYSLHHLGKPRLRFDTIWAAFAYCASAFVENESLRSDLEKAEANIASLRKHCEALLIRLETFRVERDMLLRELAAERIIHGLKE